MDSDIRFEYCDIPKCEESDIFNNYENDASDEYDDWIVPDNHDYSYIDWTGLLDQIFGGDDDESFGQNFDEEYASYDYNSTNFDDYREEYREQLDCQTLAISEPGSDYAGLVSQTSSGRKCQNWNDQTPHSHELASYGNHNYCRNYDFGASDAPLGVWCYTTDPNIKWEFCDQIPVCQTAANEIEIDNSATCGIPAVEPVWGRSTHKIGLPSRLTSRGKLQSSTQRHRIPLRYGRSSDSHRTPMTWMEMLKEKEDNRKSIYIPR